MRGKGGDPASMHLYAVPHSFLFNVLHLAALAKLSRAGVSNSSGFMGWISGAELVHGPDKWHEAESSPFPHRLDPASCHLSGPWTTPLIQSLRPDGFDTPALESFPSAARWSTSKRKLGNSIKMH